MALLGGHGVALDTRDLDKAADRVARQAGVVLHGDLGGVFCLLDAQTHQSAQARRRPWSQAVPISA